MEHEIEEKCNLTGGAAVVIGFSIGPLKSK